MLRLAAVSIPSGEPSAAVQPSSVANAKQRGRRAKRERNESASPAGLRAKRLKTTDIPQLQISSTNTPSNSSTSAHQYDFGEDGGELQGNDSDPYMSPSIVENTATSQFSSCGMCTSSIDCLCRQLGLGDPTSIPQSDLNDNDPLSILNNLPPYQPPVPLPPRPKAIPTLPASPAEIIESKHAKYPQSSCSGDPSNCQACADNAFGRAFCTALGSTVCARNPCTTCRSKASDSPESTSARPEPSSPTSVNPSLLQCCGNAVHCKRDDCSSINAQAAKATSCDTKEPVAVPCDVVWKTLEAHPNAHLANPTLGPSHLTNLNMLAEVVAHNSRCTLEPGEVEVEPEDFPARRSVHLVDEDNDDNQRSVARVQIGYEDEQAVRGSERTMVPRDVLQGHRRIITVQREGIRDAIALLDRQFGCS
jgi:AP-1-like transcription factor